MSKLSLLCIHLSNLCFDAVDIIARLFGGQKIVNLTTQELLDLSPSAFVLVDVRSADERKVSMIPGAISSSEYEKNSEAYCERIIIPYCTVGGRSYLYARKLVRKGVTVRNYRDSIIGWCSQNRPLVDDQGKATNRVHVHTAVFTVPDVYEMVS